MRECLIGYLLHCNVWCGGGGGGRDGVEVVEVGNMTRERPPVAAVTSAQPQLSD